MSKTNKVIISACLTGAGTTKEQVPTVPTTPEEIARQAVEVAKAGAAIAHIHVRKDTVVDGVLRKDYKSMDLEMFRQAVELSEKYCAEAGVDIVLNLTTSGGEYEDEKRLRHLDELRPEMCSFDPATLNWSNSYIFENHPRFLNKLGAKVKELGIRPEFEIFDTGWIDAANYYIKKYELPVGHYQFIMGVGAAMPGTAENLAFLVGKLPAGATWSVSGIGRAHMPMMLAGLALGCDGLRVGLEDNIIYGMNPDGSKRLATNVELVERCAALCRMAGREIASARDARDILSLRGYRISKQK